MQVDNLVLCGIALVWFPGDGPLRAETSRNLMYVQCISRRSIKNQHYALNYTIPLSNIQVPTCFGSSLPSSESFLDPSELPEIQIK
jgi:hypothetical protein